MPYELFGTYATDAWEASHPVHDDVGLVNGMHAGAAR